MLLYLFFFFFSMPCYVQDLKQGNQHEFFMKSVPSSFCIFKRCNNTDEYYSVKWTLIDLNTKQNKILRFCDSENKMTKQFWKGLYGAKCKWYQAIWVRKGGLVLLKDGVLRKSFWYILFNERLERAIYRDLGNFYFFILFIYLFLNLFLNRLKKYLLRIIWASMILPQCSKIE